MSFCSYLSEPKRQPWKIAAEMSFGKQIHKKQKNVKNNKPRSKILCFMDTFRFNFLCCERIIGKDSVECSFLFGRVEKQKER